MLGPGQGVPVTSEMLCRGGAGSGAPSFYQHHFCQGLGLSLVFMSPGGDPCPEQRAAIPGALVKIANEEKSRAGELSWK